MPRYRLVIDISNNAQGGKETYNFPDTVSSADALIKAKQIVWGRTAFFAQETFIDFARISEVGPRRDGLSVELAYPLGPHPSWSATAGGPVGDTLSTINDYKVGAVVRFETAAGQFFNRFLRFIPDSWAVNRRLPDGVRPYFVQLGQNEPLGDMSPGGGLSHLLVCQTFWRYIRTECVFHTKPKGGPENYLAWNYSSFRKIGSRKVGKPPGQLAGRKQSYA